MLLKDTEKKFSVPPKTGFLYENFNQTAETASYRVFEAETQNTHERHSIRILDPTKDLVANNFDLAATLFIQELFHLHTRSPGSVLINTIEISTDRKQIACAIRHSGLPSFKEGPDLKDPKIVGKLLNDLISDIEFLWRDLQIKNIASILEPENIYYLKEKGDFFLSHWDKIFEKNEAGPANLTSVVINPAETALNSRNLAAEIKALALTLLKAQKVDLSELEAIQALPNIKITTYNTVMKNTVAEGFSGLQKVQELIERMLSRDPQDLPKLEDFKIKEEKIQVPVLEKDCNEVRIEKSDAEIQVAIEESKVSLLSSQISDKGR